MAFLRMPGEKQEFRLPERARREEYSVTRSLSEEGDVFERRRPTARVIKL
ncbi:hypothetical protein GGE45_004740 [Rhizobium aethiopicum]|uniref:Uncharacterized protein n=1 Tax=Rhizobium aethiopicum TaxID=1138170 RepID=A0A7W6VRE5_9HYPH|nr:MULTISPECIES: hypothetical protein [Rhizobium]MBB4194714.1 hypothetical protein [Rhizobium aethiopicum]MBB4582384.1 hypothetical protein [Rhizobium aethiopicum]MDO3435278.1 hypothetical protein [Rhizobium sp. CBN3]